MDSVRVSLQSSSLISLRRSTPKHLGREALGAIEESGDSEMYNGEAVQHESFVAVKLENICQGQFGDFTT